MTKLNIAHIVKGEVVEGNEAEHGALVTPALNLDSLVWSRREPLPAVDVSLDEVIDLLVEVGTRLDPDTNPWLGEAMAWAGDPDPSARASLRSHIEDSLVFSKESLRFQVETELGWSAATGWSDIPDPWGGTHHVRAFPPRLVHVVAGNTPGTAAVTIVRGAFDPRREPHEARF